MLKLVDASVWDSIVLLQLLNSSFKTAGIAILLSAKNYTSFSYIIGDIIAVYNFHFFPISNLKMLHFKVALSNLH